MIANISHQKEHHMNVGKSLKIALAQKGMKQNALAAQLGVTTVWISRLANSEKAGTTTVEKLAAAFDMKISEFVALGEK